MKWQLSRLSIVLSVTTAAAASLSAQSPHPLRSDDQRGRPWWVLAWSPLTEIAELERRVPRSNASSSTLLYPVPKIGLFWTAANPGALAFEVDESRTDFSGWYMDEKGDYKRPLDGQRTSNWGLSGLSWVPVAENGAVIGNVVFGEDRPEVLNGASLEPYGSSPFAVTDTTLSGFRRTRASLEGATGWRFGAWGLGLSAGYEVTDNRTDRDPVPVFGRSTRPAAAAGVIRDFGNGKLRAGLHGRWQGYTETVYVVSAGAATVVHQLEGYSEPPDLQLVGQAYFRRIESDALGGAASLGGVIWQTQWVVFTELARLDSWETSVRAEDPLLDHWRTQSATVGAAVQRGVGNSMQFTLAAFWTGVTGEGERDDVEGIVFRADESAFATDMELRLVPTTSGWTGALGVSLRREDRKRTDAIAEVASDIATWDSGFDVEIGRWFGSKLAFSLAYSRLLHSSNWALPNPAAMGSVYQAYTAPELALYATESQPQATKLAVRWQISDLTAAFATGSYTTLSPSTNPNGAVPGAPGGDRTGWGLVGGVILGGGR